MHGPKTLAIRVLVLLALAVRLLPAPLSVLLTGPEPLLGFTICHADDHGSTPDPGKPASPTHDCALCPICLWPASALLAVEGSQAPAASTVAQAAYTWPPAAGPPAPRSARPHSTGPPA